MPRGSHWICENCNRTVQLAYAQQDIEGVSFNCKMCGKEMEAVIYE